MAWARGISETEDGNGGAETLKPHRISSHSFSRRIYVSGVMDTLFLPTHSVDDPHKVRPPDQADSWAWFAEASAAVSRSQRP